MKRIYTFLFGILTAVGVSAQVVDTLTDVRQVDRVLLLRTDSSLTVELYGREGNPDFRLRHTHTSASDAVIESRAMGWDFAFPTLMKDRKKECKAWMSMGGLHFGFVTALAAPQGMKVDMGASYEIGFEALKVNRRWGNDVFSVGLGFNWKNYRMTGYERFVTDNGRTLLGTYPTGAEPEYSRIKTFSVSFPVEYTRRLKHRWEIGLAAILNVNTYASAETRYMLDGKAEKDFSKNLHHNRISVDLRGSVRWRGVGAYVKYSPCSVLKQDFGPKFSGLSTGLTLFM